MVDSLPESFKRSFELGITNYLKGKWADARLQYLFLYLVCAKRLNIEIMMDPRKLSFRT